MFYQHTAHKMEGLVKLEAKYGPVAGHSPAVDDILDYLIPVNTRNYITIR